MFKASRCLLFPPDAENLCTAFSGSRVPEILAGSQYMEATRLQATRAQRMLVRGPIYKTSSMPSTRVMVQAWQLNRPRTVNPSTWSQSYSGSLAICWA